ncbi:2-phosphosulfolactate phosphatase [Compostibacter hankyongensis]|uniref:Probable 2-phosphosulfolactate phosphatase n=1 Tax=Compostibacter hankyongensis TaxID=1007089 RepID=A0ABP8G0P0_9BACT
MRHDNLPTLEVCASPALLHLYNVPASIVVIIDVLRATSTIASALYNGAARVIPVDSVEACIRTGLETGGLTAGERDGKVVEGLQHGNSPLEYPRSFIEGKTLVLTTTNGTRLLHKSAGARQIITGSFPNLSAVCDYLTAQQLPVILGCAAWKDRINLEDLLFAGAVAERLAPHFHVHCDTALAAGQLYRLFRDDLFSAVRKAVHYERLAAFGLEEDVRYCLTPDIAPVLPLLQNGALKAAAR